MIIYKLRTTCSTTSHQLPLIHHQCECVLLKIHHSTAYTRHVSYLTGIEFFPTFPQVGIPERRKNAKMLKSPFTQSNRRFQKIIFHSVLGYLHIILAFSEHHEKFLNFLLRKIYGFSFLLTSPPYSPSPFILPRSFYQAQIENKLIKNWPTPVEYKLYLYGGA